MKNYCVVISKPWPVDPVRDKVAEDLAAKLVANGVHTLIMPEIYHLSPDAEAPDVLRTLKTPVIFCSWLQGRAIYWTLMFLGIPAARKARFGEGQKQAGDALLCVNLSERDSADKWLPELRKYFGGQFPGGTGKLLRVESGSIKERWYPVIDQQRCQNCMECAEFCLFGVYAKTSAGRVAVANPDACKPGCPACSRICPNQAIIFPLHEEDPAIAGAENAKVRPFDAETLAKIRKHREKAGPPAPQHAAALKTLVKACGCKTTPGAGNAGILPAGGLEARAPNGGNDSYFDQVITDVVKGS